MALTDQMRGEVNFIDAQLEVLYTEAHTNFPERFYRVKSLYDKELNAYKVKLEILFSETDLKEQSKIHLWKMFVYIFDVFLIASKDEKARILDMLSIYYRLEGLMISGDM